MRDLSVYIHIPFCLAKCAYCDFLSFEGQDDYFEKYADALCEEIEKTSKELSAYQVITVFFGGGTPTVLSSKLLNKILSTVKNNFVVASDAEITIESNPETSDYYELKSLRKGGFNRVSIGVQAWQNHLLEKIGRVHSAQKAEEAFSHARKAGFDNINIDLMFALPEQAVINWEESLQKTIELNPEHISCYSLTLEEDSKLLDDKNIILPDDETDRSMYYTAKSALKAAGYKHYEISNFAKPGKESRHNKVYWVGGEYIGFGLGAHSFMNGCRFHNISDFNKYLSLEFSAEDREFLTDDDKYMEFMILGLRLISGVNEGDFLKRFGTTVGSVYGKEIEEGVKHGLLAQEGDDICLTEKGIDLSNQIFVKFLH